MHLNDLLDCIENVRDFTMSLGLSEKSRGAAWCGFTLNYINATDEQAEQAYILEEFNEKMSDPYVWRFEA